MILSCLRGFCVLFFIAVLFVLWQYAFPNHGPLTLLLNYKIQKLCTTYHLPSLKIGSASLGWQETLLEDVTLPGLDKAGVEEVLITYTLKDLITQGRVDTIHLEGMRCHAEIDEKGNVRFKDFPLPLLLAPQKRTLLPFSYFLIHNGHLVVQTPAGVLGPFSFDLRVQVEEEQPLAAFIEIEMDSYPDFQAQCFLQAKGDLLTLIAEAADLSLQEAYLKWLKVQGSYHFTT